MFRKWHELRKKNKGFTLIELMIVVAIIAILAAIAIPQYKKFQLKAKTSEAKANIDAIKTCEEAFYSEHETYLQANSSPGHPAGQQHLKIAWVDNGPADDGNTTEDNTTVNSFEEIGFEPAGRVFYDYAVATGDTVTVGADQWAQDCTIGAQADLDQDGAVGRYALALDGDNDGAAPALASPFGDTPNRFNELEGPFNDDF